MKLIYVSGSGEVLWGPTTLNAGLSFARAQGVQVTGDRMTRSWCVWKDSLAGSSEARGFILAGFNSQEREVMEPVYLGVDTSPINTISWVFDLTYRLQDQTLHFADARFNAYYSKFTIDGNILVWRQPIDTLYITERVHMATSPTGEVWAVFRNEIPNHVETMFVRFNDSGSITVQHPFGTGEEHFSTVLAFTIGPNGEAHVCAAFDDFGQRYCHLDSHFTVEEWHEMAVERQNATSAIGSNQRDDALVVWDEPAPLHTDLYASLRESDGSWMIEGNTVSAQPSDIAFLHVAPTGDQDWAVLTSIEVIAPHYDLVLFTTDSISTDVRHRRQRQQTEVVIYPNPSNGNFLIRAGRDNGEHFLVYNVLGRLLATTPTHQNLLTYSINLSNMPSGVYFICASHSQTTPIKLYLQR